MIRPVVAEGPFSFTKVNVADQQRDAQSLLSITERMIRVRKENPAFGWGEWQIVDTGQIEVLAHRCDWKGVTVVAVHNFGEQSTTIQMDLADIESREIHELLSNDNYTPPGCATDELQISGHGYRWFRLGGNKV